MFAIEKSIPIPVRSRDSRYPFKEMDVGDSFMVEFEATPPIIVTRRVRSAVSSYQKKSLAKFTVRTFDDGLRVWRVE